MTSRRSSRDSLLSRTSSRVRRISSIRRSVCRRRNTDSFSHAANTRLARFAPKPSMAGAEALADQLGDGAAVGAALGLLHHRADDPADRLLVARADLLRGLRFRLDRAIDDRLELARIGDLREPL